MSTSKSEYDYSVHLWNPAGRIFQLEYALEAVKLGTTVIGITCKKEKAVLLVAEKKLNNSLVEPDSLDKIFEIDHHIGCATAGLLADARTLVEHARNECQSHWFTYDENLSVESCVHAIADLALNFADNDDRKKRFMSRPFGVAVMLGGIDDNGEPQLWLTDPAGTCTQFTAAAIGNAKQSATISLSDQWSEDLTLKETEDLAVRVVRQTMEQEINKQRVQVAVIKLNDKGKPSYHQYTDTEVEGIIQRLPAENIM